MFFLRYKFNNFNSKDILMRGVKPVPTPAQKQVQQAVSWKDRIHPQDYELLKNTFQLFDEDQSGFIDP